MSWVVLSWWVYPVARSERGVLVVAGQVVALGACDLGDYVLVGVVIELGPPSDA